MSEKEIPEIGSVQTEAIPVKGPFPRGVRSQQQMRPAPVKSEARRPLNPELLQMELRKIKEELNRVRGRLEFLRRSEIEIETLLGAFNDGLIQFTTEVKTPEETPPME